MLIGEDYPKIELEFIGLDLLEPNAFIGDTLIFIFAIFFAYRLSKIKQPSAFFKYWRYFFIIFGIGFFLGGLGHLLYNYWGIPGKTPSWYLGIIAVFFVEKAMISIYPNDKYRKIFLSISKVKLILAIAGALAVSLFVDLESDYTQGMKVPTINSTLGLVSTLGVLGFIYARKIRGFRYFWISVLILIPAAIFQAIKLNLHQWFDKNDASHLLLIFGLFLYYAGIRSYANYLEKTSENV